MGEMEVVVLNGGELVVGVAEEHAGLAHGAAPHRHTHLMNRLSLSLSFSLSLFSEKHCYKTSVQRVGLKDLFYCHI